VGDEWITLSNIFDNLRVYQKHLYGCGILAGGRCDCGLLRYQGHMEDIVHRFANECALISKSSGGEASTAAATSSAGNPAMREDLSHQREDTPGFNDEDSAASSGEASQPER
jgi:hypothetical protein